MEPKDKKEYELAYLVKDEADLGAPEALVRDNGCEITAPAKADKIRLAYPIEKQNEAFFGFLQFAAEPSKAKELEAVLKLDKRVMRSMIMTPPPLKEKRRMGDPAMRPSAPPREPRSVPLSNEALEKKIEEILQ